MGSRAPRLIKPFLQHRPFKSRLLSGFLPLSHICSRSHLLFARKIENQKDKLALFIHTHAHVHTHTHTQAPVFPLGKSSQSWERASPDSSDPRVTFSVTLNQGRCGEEHPSTKIRLFWVLSVRTVLNYDRKSWEAVSYCLLYVSSLNVYWGFPGGSDVKHLPARREARLQFLGWEDPLEKKMATHSSILAWKGPWTEEPGGLQSIWGRKELATTERLHVTSSLHASVSSHLKSNGKEFRVFPIMIVSPSRGQSNQSRCW